MKQYFELRVKLRDCEAMPTSQVDIVDHGRRGAQERLVATFGPTKNAVKLGQGGFGVVKGYGDAASRGYVVKKVDFKWADDNDPDNAANALRTVACEVVTLMVVNGWSEFTLYVKPPTRGRPGFAYVFMPVVNGTSMQAWLDSLNKGTFVHPWLKDRTTRPVAVDRLKSRALINLYRQIRDLHRKGLFHFDIKTQNAMIDAQGAAELIDFGTVNREGTEPTAYSALWSPWGFDEPRFTRSLSTICADYFIEVGGTTVLHRKVEAFVDALVSFARSYKQNAVTFNALPSAQYDLFSFCHMVLRAQLAIETLLPLAEGLTAVLDSARALDSDGPFAADFDAHMDRFAVATGFDERVDDTKKRFNVLRRARLAAVEVITKAGKPRQLADGAFFLSRKRRQELVPLERRELDRRQAREALSRGQNEVVELAFDLAALEKNAIESELTLDLDKVSDEAEATRDALALYALFMRLEFFKPEAFDLTSLLARDGTLKRKLEKEDVLTLYVQQLKLVASFADLKRALTRIFGLAYVNRGLWAKDQTKTATTIYAAITHPTNAAVRRIVEKATLFGEGCLASPSAFRRHVLAHGAGTPPSNTIKGKEAEEAYLKSLGQTLDALSSSKQRARGEVLAHHGALLRLIEDRKLTIDVKRAVGAQLERSLNEPELKEQPGERTRRLKLLEDIAILDAGGAPCEAMVRAFLPKEKPVLEESEDIDPTLLVGLTTAIELRLNELTEAPPPRRNSIVDEDRRIARNESVNDGRGLLDDDPTRTARRPSHVDEDATVNARQPRMPVDDASTVNARRRQVLDDEDATVNARPQEMPIRDASTVNTRRMQVLDDEDATVFARRR